jgi:hypothetical protein
MQEPSLPIQTPAFRQVHSGHGVEWWSAAWKWLFHPGATAVWIVMCLIAMVIVGLLHVVPLFGTIAGQIGSFVFAGGLMLAARKTDEGTTPAVGDLFAGFGPSLGPLVIAGALLVVAALLVAGAASVAGIGAVVGAVFGGLAGNLALLAGLGATSLLVALIALLLLLPIGMAAWFAPALIVFRKQPPVEALKASLAACWANLGPLAVYGLLWIAFAIVASIPFGLGWLVLAPLMALSTYAAYRDLFEDTLTRGPSSTQAGEGS